MPNPDWLQPWYDALRAKHGVVLHCISTQAQTKMNLYSARRSANDPDLAGLSIVVPPGSTDVLWIVRNGKEIPQTTPEGDGESL